MLLTIHLAASKFLEAPELQLAEEEAAALAAAGAKVAEQYNAVLNPKAAAWLNLAGVVGTIYGTRIYAIFSRNKAAVEERKAKVVDIKMQARAAAAQNNASQAATPADVFGMGYTGAIAVAAEM